MHRQLTPTDAPPAGTAEATPAARDCTPTGYTTQQVLDALHHAAHDIVCATNAGEGLYDALDLMINTSVGYLTGQARNLEQVVDQRYETSLPAILGWITAEATR